MPRRQQDSRTYQHRVAEPAVPSGRVTALEPQAKRPNRFNLYVDGRFALGLSEAVARRVRVGQELTVQEMTGLAAEEQFETAYEAALGFLGYRPRSESEVRTRLGRSYSPDSIDRVIARLREANLLSDQEFAQFWVENREGFRPRSARALKHELRQKGIDDEKIQVALENLDERASAYRAARPKAERFRDLDWREFERKIGGLLARRGFDYATAREVVKQLYQELNGPEPEEGSEEHE